MLLGLFLTGWLKVLLKTEHVTRLLGRPNLASALRAVLLGIPLPVCSCSVVPLSLGLKEKGASREANLALVTSAPETSADTLVMSWGLLGPFMTVARPLISLLAALLAAVLSIGRRALDPQDDAKDKPARETGTAAVCDSGIAADEDAVGFRVFGRAVVAAIERVYGSDDKKSDEGEGGDAAPVRESAAATPGLFKITARAMHYGFVRMFADISLWLMIGIVLAGLVASLVPETVFQQIPGGSLGTMLFMAALSIPMYVCAVESTPIAAMLILKGVSPGAVLVFLIAGPATNLTSMLLIRQHHGKRFFWIHLIAVFAAAVGSGAGG